MFLLDVQVFVEQKLLVGVLIFLRVLSGLIVVI